MSVLLKKILQIVYRYISILEESHAKIEIKYNF